MQEVCQMSNISKCGDEGRLPGSSAALFATWYLGFWITSSIEIIYYKKKSIRWGCVCAHGHWF